VKKELLLNSEARVGFIPENTDGTAIAGPIFDRTNFLSALIHGVVGAVTGAPTDLDLVITLYAGETVDDEDTPTSITDEAATNFVLTVADAQAGSAEDFINVDLTGVPKWVRIGAVATFTGGTTPTADVACTFTLSDPRYSEDVSDAQNVDTYYVD
jgi:hypothetical protein